MKRVRLILLIALVAFLISAAFIWLNRPQPVDMAAYAPADSLLYLEANRPLEVFEAIAHTDAWKLLHQELNLPSMPQQGGWSHRFVRWTGIGPIESVLLTRSQIAVVITDWGAAEEGSVLRVKPEGALLVETHTSERRTRAPVEQALQRMAESAYGNPTHRRINVDGVELSEWRSSDGSRQLLAGFSGTLVIIGNSTRAMQKCLSVAGKREPSLKDDDQIQGARTQVGTDGSLTFGYVPSDKSARLISVGIPMVMGRAPGDAQFQGLISRGAANIFGALAWSSRPFKTGIEDRYLISLRPQVIAHLKPTFSSLSNGQPPSLAVDDSYSITQYKFSEPSAAWEGLKTAISSHVDALTALVFSSILKSGLVAYGVEEPEEFLQTLAGSVTTVRLEQGGEESILVARVKEPHVTRELLVRKMGFRPGQQIGQTEIFEKQDGEFAAGLNGDLLTIGQRSAVLEYSRNSGHANTTPARITAFSSPENTAPIITFTADSERVRSFGIAVLAITRSAPRDFARSEKDLSRIPFSVTETTLTEHGVERLTRSPLGQFSTLLPLLMPEKQVPAQ